MMLYKDEGKELLYYRKGICTAKVIINENQILVNNRNLETSEWSGFNPYHQEKSLGGTTDFTMPLNNLSGLINKLSNAVWSGDRVEIANDIVYTKYYEIVGCYQGQVMTSAIWSSVGAGSMLIDLVICDQKIIGFIKPGLYEVSFLIEPGYEDLTPLKIWFDDSLSKAGRGVRQIATFMVTMRDGIKLATDVYLPADYKEGEMLPSILLRTPYNRKEYCQYDSIYADRGYAVITQDMRGKYDSEGAFVMGCCDKKDGSDTMDWIANQIWSNGSVGTLGGSHGGYMQWAIASTENKHHKAIVCTRTSSSGWEYFYRVGGALGMFVMPVLIAKEGKIMDWERVACINWAEILKTRPIASIPEKILDRKSEIWELLRNHINFDEFWEENESVREPEKLKVPALFQGGWYDLALPDGCLVWNGLRIAGFKERRLMMLAGNHIELNERRQFGDFKFPGNALRYDFDLVQLKWFDKFLKDIDNKVQEIKAECYLVGLNQWVEFDEWPPTQSVMKDFYLASTGKAGTIEGDGELLETMPETINFDSYSYDPEDPTPHLMNMTSNNPNNGPIEIADPMDYKEVEKRRDVLVYTTKQFTKPMAITGSAIANFFASSSARDTDWCVRLTVVNENGNSYRLADMILRAQYRNSFAEPELLSPGKIEEYTIELPFTGYYLRKGDRIRVQITSSAYNLVFPNTNTGENPYDDTTSIIAEQKIYHGGEYKSKISIPLLDEAFIRINNSINVPEKAQ